MHILCASFRPTVEDVPGVCEHSTARAQTPPSPPQLTIDNPTSLPIFRRDFKALLGKDDDDVRSYKNSTIFGYSLKIVLVLVVGAGLTS